MFSLRFEAYFRITCLLLAIYPFNTDCFGLIQSRAFSGLSLAKSVHEGFVPSRDISGFRQW